MAKSKLIKGISAVNQNLHICFVAESQLQESLKMGYQYLMMKVPDLNDMPKLTPPERKCLRLVIKGIPLKAIAEDIGVLDHTVRAALRSVRRKFDCSTDTELVAKIYHLGLNPFI